MTTKIDLLVKELIAKRNAEDVSSYAHLPGVITEDETADKYENKPTEVDSEKLSQEEIPDIPEELLILIEKDQPIEELEDGTKEMHHKSSLEMLKSNQMNLKWPQTRPLCHMNQK